MTHLPIITAAWLHATLRQYSWWPFQILLTVQKRLGDRLQRFSFHLWRYGDLGDSPPCDGDLGEGDRDPMLRDTERLLERLRERLERRLPLRERLRDDAAERDLDLEWERREPPELRDPADLGLCV